MHKCYESEGVAMLDDIKFVTIPAKEQHTATIIWLHGLGDTGRGMSKLAQLLVDVTSLAHVKIILPSAPIIWVTNLKMGLSSWFDYYSSDIPNRQEDEEGLYRTTRWVNDFISMEGSHCGIPPDRIIVGGFSQGGAVSLLTGITTERKFAGIFALSTYIPLRKKTQEITSPIFSSMPIFWGHGKMDLQTEYKFALSSTKALATQLNIPFHSFDSGSTSEDTEKNGVEGIKFHSYETLGHWIEEKELDDLRMWVEILLPKQNMTDEVKGDSE